MQLNLAVRSFGKHFQRLRVLAARLGELHWQITPKVHYMMHLPKQGKLLNPRFCQNYLEEGLIGRVTKIWKMSVSGPYARTVQKVVLTKYLVGTALRDSR